MHWGLMAVMLAGTAIVGQAQPAPAGPAGAAERAVLEGRADDAITLLRRMLTADANDAQAHLLLCRVYLSEGLSSPAVAECEAAVAAAPNSSDAALWLGRAYGAKASSANALQAFPLARKVHASFERAVALDGRNGPALSDLGQFYVEAPAIVGGGLDKARALAARMGGTPVRAHRLLAQAAQKAGDPGRAEMEFRNAGRSPEALVDLAQFFATQGRPDDAVAAIEQAVATDRSHGPATVDAAMILTSIGREPALASRCLRQYLESAAKTDAWPAFRVHHALAELLRAQGNTREADAQDASAKSLDSAYGAGRA